MGRHRKHENNAARSRAFRRRRKADMEELLYQELSSRGGVVINRKAMLVILAKVCGMLGSDHAGERDVAALTAMKILKDEGLSWYDIFGVEEPKK